MSNKKKSIRKKFREETMQRDKYKCCCCGKKGKDRQGGSGHLKFHDDKNLVELDAHHISSREEMPNGGYVKENGISVCDDCHLKAENVELGFEPEKLYEIIGSSHDSAIKSSTLL